MSCTKDERIKKELDTLLQKVKSLTDYINNLAYPEPFLLKGLLLLKIKYELLKKIVEKEPFLHKEKEKWEELIKGIDVDKSYECKIHAQARRTWELQWGYHVGELYSWKRDVNHMYSRAVDALSWVGAAEITFRINKALEKS